MAGPDAFSAELRRVGRPSPGWDEAEVRCGGCGMSFSATSQADLVYRRGLHREAHSLVDHLTPKQRAQLLADISHITKTYDGKKP